MVWTGNATRQPAFTGPTKFRVPAAGLPNADRVMEQGSVLPSNHGLDDEDIDYIWVDRGGFLSMTKTGNADRLILISADGHAGGNHEQYRTYLESKYLGGVRCVAWALYESIQGPHRGDPETELGRRAGVWPSKKHDGVVAEVLFPNTIPPFFPTGAVVARPPGPDDYELRLAGVRAHNRWLADWCAGQADRRAGIGQIFLNDLDDAIETSLVS